jgi:hypothetical protein
MLLHSKDGTILIKGTEVFHGAEGERRVDAELARQPRVGSLFGPREVYRGSGRGFGFELLEERSQLRSCT